MSILEEFKAPTSNWRDKIGKFDDYVYQIEQESLPESNERYQLEKELNSQKLIETLIQSLNNANGLEFEVFNKL